MIYVNPSELHDIWPLIRRGLEIVAKKSEADWIPEDIYMALRQGKSTLHIDYNGDEYDGFVVITETPDYHGLTLYIWAAYCVTHNAIDRYLPTIKEMARSVGAKKIRFGSPRKGWAKRFKAITTIYEEEV